MAERTQGRWAYVVGIGVLAGVVILALVFRGDRRAAGTDGGLAEGPTDADRLQADAARAEDTVNAEVALGATPPPVDAGPVTPPEDRDGCEAYCRGLAQRGELSAGVTAERCVEQLCAEAGSAEEEPEGSPEAPARPPEPSGAEVSSDCEAQCRSLHASGELRRGMTVAQCVEAMCSED